jgi:deoxyribodipyrimidine photo-lyase
MATTATAAGAPPQPRRRLIAWLRSDLRLHDNVVLNEAAQRVKRGEADEVLPVYVLDPRNFAPSAYGTAASVVDGAAGGAAAAASVGLPKMGPYRAKFLLESLADLQRSLRALGSDLTVRVGPAEEVIPPLQGSATTTVLVHEEVASEEAQQEARVERALKRAAGAAQKGGPKVVRLWGGATMYHPDDLPFAKGTMADLPDVFTQCEFLNAA